MKKFTGIFVLLIVTLCCFTACANDPSINNEPPPSGPIASIDPAQPSDNDDAQREIITKMFVTINGNKLEITLAENSSVDALVEILKKNDITYAANDYGDFEKVGDIGYALPQNNAQIAVQAGDVILYQGRNICLYYGTNSWNFTRIGKINGYSASELRVLLGAGNGNATVILSLD